MSRIVNATKLVAANARLANQIRGEANHWTGTRRDDLIKNATQVSLSNAWVLKDPESVIAVHNAGLNILTLAMTQRANAHLAAFLADPEGFAHE